MKRTRTRAQTLVKKLRNDLKFYVMKYEIVMIMTLKDIIDMVILQNGV